MVLNVGYNLMYQYISSSLRLEHCLWYGMFYPIMIINGCYNFNASVYFIMFQLSTFLFYARLNIKFNNLIHIIDTL